MIDRAIDDDQLLNGSEITLLIEWIQSDPHHADIVFERFFMHVSLREHHANESYETLKNSSESEKHQRYFSKQYLECVVVEPKRHRIQIMAIVLLMTILIGFVVYEATFRKTEMGPKKKMGIDNDFLKSSLGSAWANDFKIPNSQQDLLKGRYNLLCGFASLIFDEDTRMILAGDTSCKPIRSGYVYLDYGRFAVNKSSSEEYFTIELPILTVKIRQACFCGFFRDGQFLIDVLEGTVEVLSKDNSFDPYRIAANQVLSVSIESDGITAQIEPVRTVDSLGPLVSLLTNRKGLEMLSCTIAYEGFEGDAQKNDDARIPLASYRSSTSWGWKGRWSELGGLDAAIVYSQANQLAADRRIMFRYCDANGHLLQSSGGQLQTALGRHTHCAVTLGGDVEELNAYDESRKMIGKDNSTIWLSFIAQSFDERCGNQRCGYVYLGEYDYGLKIGKLGSIPTGHWAIEGRTKDSGSSFRINDYHLSGQMTFFVVKIEFLQGPEQISVWLNPPLEDESNIPEPDLQIKIPDFRFDEIGIYSTYSTDFDEIRLGSSFTSVTPRAK